MKPPAIAELRARLTLQIPVDVIDDNGGVMRNYINGASLWGQITPAAVNDRFYAQQMETSITHRIALRYRIGITGQMRLVLGARVFLIHGIEVVNERGRYLLCHCEEVRP